MTDHSLRSIARTMLSVVLVPILCLHSTAAHAVQQWSKAGHWYIFMDPGDNCFAVDSFDEGWLFGLSLTSERKSVAVLGGPVPYALDSRPDITWTASDGSSFSGQAIVMPIDGGGKRIMALASSEFMTKMETSTSVRIDGTDTKIVSLELTGTAAALAELRRCMTELIKLDTGTGQPATVKPVAKNLASIVTADDYPVAAQRSEASGRTSVALTISAHGLVSDCSVMASSGNVDLDAATCRLMRLRARFTPASDAAGKATVARYETSINWQIPAS
ncbi:TonB family protein [Sphingomonas sp.]|uniref:TonB family protein n=1 Tax=Sphingomonas sp. TaxID=28214 RepID=UPI0025F36FBE|nr:TonB family protein [Sphingomonas sp.]